MGIFQRSSTPLLFGGVSLVLFAGPMYVEKLWHLGPLNWVVLWVWYSVPLLAVAVGLGSSVYLFSKYVHAPNIPLVFLGMFFCLIVGIGESLLLAILAEGGV